MFPNIQALKHWKEYVECKPILYTEEPGCHCLEGKIHSELKNGTLPVEVYNESKLNYC
jgi:hypothetical protein